MDRTMEEVIAILNKHKHRAHDDWFWDISVGEVLVPNSERMPIHPIDARIVASYYDPSFESGT